ncbi:MAG TPA: DoxX family membrane protein, partial [Bacteroidota bacterium]|nr:DoxX family membrane protein [Bacteroidota bacterium]
MQTIPVRWQQWAPTLRSILRIAAAFMFMQAGTMKLFSYPIALPPGAGPLKLLSEVGIAGLLETFGGGLLLLGLFTRPIALLLSGEMAV